MSARHSKRVLREVYAERGRLYEVVVTVDCVSIVESKMEDDRQCSLCDNREEAQHLCICNLVHIGPACLASHKDLTGFHFILPIEAQKEVNSTNVLEISALLFSLSRSHKQLEDNINLFTECERQIENRFTNLKEKMKLAKEEILRDLHELKAKFEIEVKNVVEETRRMAYRRDYQPSSSLAKALWEHSQNRKPIEAFTYMVIEDVSIELFKKGISFRCPFSIEKKVEEQLDISSEVDELKRLMVSREVNEAAIKKQTAALTQEILKLSETTANLQETTDKQAKELQACMEKQVAAIRQTLDEKVAGLQAACNKWETKHQEMTAEITALKASIPPKPA